MIREKDWELFSSYPNEASAAVVAEYFRRNDCPAQVVAGLPWPDSSTPAVVLVPGELMHRARWLWAQRDLTEGELEYLLTGKLPGQSDDPGAAS